VVEADRWTELPVVEVGKTMLPVVEAGKAGMTLSPVVEADWVTNSPVVSLLAVE
jgi:hypothetical protein